MRLRGKVVDGALTNTFTTFVFAFAALQYIPLESMAIYDGIKGTIGSFAI